MIIAYELHKRDWKQYELADKISTPDKPVSDKTVSSWIEGSRNVGIDNLKKLCKVFHCDLNYLVGMQSLPNRRVASVYDLTGLSEQAIEILIKIKKDKDKPALDFISLFITDYKYGTPSMATMINMLLEATDEINQREMIVSDGKGHLMPKKLRGTTEIENDISISLYHISRTFNSMIDKYRKIHLK